MMSVTDVKWRVTATVTGVVTERLRDRKREDTHERILRAGLRLFSENGYAPTTTAEIAAAAGVTERTFFRHFPTKIDLFLTSFRQVAAAADTAMAAQPEGTAPIEVVRAGVLAFAAEAADTLRIEPDRSRIIWGPELGRTMLEVVLQLESSVVRELARRLDVSRELVELRMVANASIGVLRAAARAQLVNRPREPLRRVVSDGLDRISPLFAALDQAREEPPARGRGGRRGARATA
jgi:AcrR family transcriptional regulator